MKALVGAFNQEKALVGAFSVIVQPVVEPMEHYTALVLEARHDPAVLVLHASVGQQQAGGLGSASEGKVSELDLGSHGPGVMLVPGRAG